MKHIIRIHGSISEYECDECAYISATERDLRRHVIIKHENSNE